MAEHLVNMSIAQPTAFPQIDAELGSGKIATDGWIEDQALIRAQAPLLAEKEIIDYYAPLGTKQNEYVRVLARGFAHIASHVAMKYFGFHPLPFASRPDLRAIRYRSHASYKSHDYMVSYCAGTVAAASVAAAAAPSAAADAAAAAAAATATATAAVLRTPSSRAITRLTNKICYTHKRSRTRKRTHAHMSIHFHR